MTSFSFIFLNNHKDTYCWKSTKTYDEFLTILMNKIVITTHNNDENMKIERKKDK